MILSWLLSVLIENCNVQVLECESSCDVPKTLERDYNSSIRPRLMQLKIDLQNLKIGPKIYASLFQ